MLTQEDIFLIGMYQENKEQIPDDLHNKLRKFTVALNKKLVVPIHQVSIDLNAPSSMQVELRSYNDGSHEVYNISIEDFLAGNVGIPTNVSQQVLLTYTLMPFFGTILSWVGWYFSSHILEFAISATMCYIAALVDGLNDVNKLTYKKFKFGTNILFLVPGAILTLLLFIAQR